MVVSEDLDIIMNAQCCCGTIQDLCIAIQKKYSGMVISMASSAHCGLHCPLCAVIHVLEDGLGWFTILHPAYSLYLSVCEVCVFDLLKNTPRAMN